MKDLLLFLNFTCIRYRFKRYDTLHALYIVDNQNPDISKGIVILLNKISTYTGSKSNLVFIEGSERNRRYSVRSKKTSAIALYSEVDSGTIDYRIQIEYYNRMFMIYLFSIFNIQTYSCMNIINKHNMNLIINSKFGSYYIYHYINSNEVKWISRFENAYNGIRKNTLTLYTKIPYQSNNIILLNESQETQILNKNSSNFYTKPDSLVKAIRKSYEEICNTKYHDETYIGMSINCKVINHILNIYKEEKIFDLLLDKAKHVESIINDSTFIRLYNKNYDLYFDVSRLYFIIRTTTNIKLVFYDTYNPKNVMIITNFIDTIVNKHNEIYVKYSIIKDDRELGEYSIIYQDKIKSINNKEKNLIYHSLLKHFMNKIKSQINKKMFVK